MGYVVEGQGGAYLNTDYAASCCPESSGLAALLVNRYPEILLVLSCSSLSSPLFSHT